MSNRRAICQACAHWKRAENVCEFYTLCRVAFKAYISRPYSVCLLHVRGGAAKWLPEAPEIGETHATTQH